MKQRLVIFAILFLFIIPSFAQNVAISNNSSTPDASAMLDVQSSTKGILIPRMTSVEKAAITNPATGLLIYQTDMPQGFWYFDGAAWEQMSTQPAGAVNFRYSSGIAAQSVNANQNTTVIFDAKSFLNNSTFANNTFTAPSPGIYNFNINLNMYGNNQTTLYVSILVNGVTRTSTNFNIVYNLFQAINFHDYLTLLPGDLVSVQVRSAAVLAISLGEGTSFSGFKVN